MAKQTGVHSATSFYYFGFQGFYFKGAGFFCYDK